MSLQQINYTQIRGGTPNFKDFGAVGDGVADDTAAIQSAITNCPDDVWIDGSGLTYLITSQITASNLTFKLRNANFVTTTTYATQGYFTVTSTYIDLENIYVDGGRGTYKTGSETWSVFSAFGGYSSIAPTLTPFFDIIKYDALCKVNINNVNFYNMFADSCIQVGTYGTVFINDCEYKNIANKTFHVYHSPDDGVTQAGRTFVSNVYAEDVGILPAAYLVGGVAKTRADAYSPQGSFNFIVSHGSFTINNAIVKNYCSCGVTADRNLSFNSNNVYITSSSPYSFSNNPSGAFWLEACNSVNVSNLFVQISDRDARDTALDSSALQIYCSTGSQATFSNCILLTNGTTAKINKIIRGSVRDNPSIYMDNFYCYGLAGTPTEAVSFLQLPNSTIGLDLKLDKGYLRSGSLTIESPQYCTINSVILYGETNGGNLLIPVSGNPGVTGSVGNITISECALNDITSTVNVTGSLTIANSSAGTISSAASSGKVLVLGNATINGGIDIVGASATSGTALVLDNALINGVTTVYSGRNARVSNNTTNRRIEIKDVQTFEVVGNTAKTDQAEPIIWINPVTTANVLAGVISSNNVLIKTGTAGAGYVTIAGGVTGVTDVNNNKLTVAWS